MMISVEDAKRLIFNNCKLARRLRVKLPDALGSVLASDIFSPIDTPPFDQSAVDGYAFSFESWDGQSSLTIVGEVQAGSTFDTPIGKHQAVRIFTGALVPLDVDTVVMQELVEVVDDSMIIKDELLTLNRNVRPKASQTKAGFLTLPKGHCMTPASISLLASLGVNEVEVFDKPRVSIIVTGKELIPAGQPLEEGKIFESNAQGLQAALRMLRIEPVSIELVGDEKPAIMEAINSASNADIIIMTGGASVGDYDFVPSALEECGATKVFHKVKQRPGKPFYFGTLDKTIVFGLPGNPAAVLACFYEYIVPAITSFTTIEYFKKRTMVLANGYKKKPQLTYFLKGKTDGDQVEILDNQQSYLMTSFAYADCLIHLDEGREAYEVGDEVEVLMIV